MDNITGPHVDMSLTNSATNSYQQRPIGMTLENTDLWQSFNSIGTEMIITKQGRRMFPYCIISLTGLQPLANYTIMMDMVPADDYKHKWRQDHWEIVGKANPEPTCRTYKHPNSPASGKQWMRQSLSFKIKLTNNYLNQHGHIVLHSMHRYHPRFHVMRADSPSSVWCSSLNSFTFPETIFMAVTDYRNPRIARLKIDTNPYARRFRNGCMNCYLKSFRPHKRSEAEKSPAEKNGDSVSPINASSPSLQMMPSSWQLVEEGNPVSVQPALKESHPSAWAVEQHSSESIHVKTLELQEYDYSCEEQTVPLLTTPQPDRFPFASRNTDGAQALVHPPLPSLEHVTPQYGFHHNNSADYGQFPLFFSSSRWPTLT